MTLPNYDKASKFEYKVLLKSLKKLKNCEDEFEKCEGDYEKIAPLLEQFKKEYRNENYSVSREIYSDMSNMMHEAEIRDKSSDNQRIFNVLINNYYPELKGQRVLLNSYLQNDSDKSTGRKTVAFAACYEGKNGIEHAVNLFKDTFNAGFRTSDKYLKNRAMIGLLAHELSHTALGHTKSDLEKRLNEGISRSLLSLIDRFKASIGLDKIEAYLYERKKERDANRDVFKRGLGNFLSPLLYREKDIPNSMKEFSRNQDFANIYQEFELVGAEK